MKARKRSPQKEKSERGPEMNKKFLDMYTDFIFVEHPPAQADVLFIPGSGTAALGEKAALLWKLGFAEKIVVSGKYSILKEGFEGAEDYPDRYPGSYPTEAAFLADVLRQNGVAGQAVLLEEKAAYTYENAIYSRQITDGAGLEVGRAILCCKPFHARRCLLYYQLLYPETEFLVCPCESTVKRDNWYKTREGIELVLGEVERCGGQFYKILQENLVKTDKM